MPAPSDPADRLIAAIQLLTAAQVNVMLAGVAALAPDGKPPAEQDWGRLNGNMEVAERECREAVAALLRAPAPGPSITPSPAPEPAPPHFRDRLAQDIYAHAIAKHVGSTLTRPDHAALIAQAHAAAEQFFSPVVPPQPPAAQVGYRSSGVQTEQSSDLAVIYAEVDGVKQEVGRCAWLGREDFINGWEDARCGVNRPPRSFPAKTAYEHGSITAKKFGVAR